MKLRILGSGTSTGVPEIGCKCEVCTSADPRDNRLRASSLLHTDDAVILIDCGPDFREQMLRVASFGKIDGVLITHEHYDHVGGLDDLRPFCRFGEIPIYSDNYTATHLRARMPYCFWNINIRCTSDFLARSGAGKELLYQSYGDYSFSGDARASAYSGISYR